MRDSARTAEIRPPPAARFDRRSWRARRRRRRAAGAQHRAARRTRASRRRAGQLDRPLARGSLCRRPRGSGRPSGPGRLCDQRTCPPAEAACPRIDPFDHPFDRRSKVQIDIVTGPHLPASPPPPSTGRLLPPYSLVKWEGGPGGGGARCWLVWVGSDRVGLGRVGPGLGRVGSGLGRGWAGRRTCPSGVLGSGSRPVCRRLPPPPPKPPKQPPPPRVRCNAVSGPGGYGQSRASAACPRPRAHLCAHPPFS
jgi:hypothetical protein